MESASVRAEDIAPWLAVFPEHSQVGGVASVRELLSEIDRVPDSLERWRASSNGPSVLPLRTTRPPVPSAASHIPFAWWFSGQVSDLVDQAVASIAAQTAMRPDEPWTSSLLLTAIETASACQLRAVLLLLAERRRARLDAGETPSNRYEAFERWLGSIQGRETFDRRFGDLARRARAMVAMHMGAIVDDLVATADRWPDLRKRLDLRGERICELEAKGDAHNAGHRVMIGRTEFGDRVVIKPRGVVMEAAYAQWSQFLADLVNVEMPQPRTVQSDRVGWMEFVGPPSDGESQAVEPHEDYFTMIGVHLAALYLVNGTDIHFENVLTDVRGRPVVIDTEALFAPSVGTSSRGELRGVGSIGLLSIPMGSSDVNLGALEYRPGGESPLRSWVVVNPGRDDIRLEMRSSRVDHAAAVPEAAVFGHDAAVSVIATFSSILTWVASNIDSVNSELDEIFSSRTSVRYIHRPTMAYVLVQRMATHPQFATDRDWGRALGRVAVLPPEHPHEIISAEIEQMRRGDIPYFSVRLDSVNVCGGLGEATGVVLANRPRDEVAEALRNLSCEQICRQVSDLEDALGHWLANQ